MARVSSRHEGDLSGQLRPFAETELMPVTLVIAEDTAHLAPAQHAAWMLLNILA